MFFYAYKHNLSKMFSLRKSLDWLDWEHNGNFSGRNLFHHNNMTLSFTVLDYFKTALLIDLAQTWQKKK